VVNGSFELQNFHAGAYFLTLRVADAPPAIALASAVLNVNADVDGMVLSLGEGLLRVESSIVPHAGKARALQPRNWLCA